MQVVNYPAQQASLVHKQENTVAMIVAMIMTNIKGGKFPHPMRRVKVYDGGGWGEGKSLLVGETR